MGFPETNALERLRALHPLWTITSHPTYLSAHRHVHPAMFHLASWSYVHAATLDGLADRLDHLDTLAQTATELLMITTPPDHDDLTRIHRALHRL